MYFNKVEADQLYNYKLLKTKKKQRPRCVLLSPTPQPTSTHGLALAKGGIKGKIQGDDLSAK